MPLSPDPGLPASSAPDAMALRPTYLQLTRTATYSFLVALPLLVLYEVLIRVAGTGEVVAVRVGAEVWIKALLASIGATGSLLLSATVLVVGMVILFAERHRRIPLRPRYFVFMVGESAVYAVIVALLVSSMVGAIFAFAPDGPRPLEPGLLTQLALSIGAGLYEELFFRVLLVGGMYWVLWRVSGRRTAAYVIAAVLGAAVFSAVHYTGSMGDVFTLPSFTFRFLFGLALNVLFLVRGFGVAAWTHALYDVMIVTHLLG